MACLKQCSLFIFLLFLTSCVPDDLPQIKGNYFGWLKNDSQVTEVYGVISSYKDEGKKGVSAHIDLYPVSATSDVLAVDIRFNQHHQVILESALFENELRLDIEDVCAKNNDATLCFSNDHIDFAQTNAKTLVVSKSLTLAKTTRPLPYEIEHIYTLDELLGRARFYSFKRASDLEDLFQSKERVLAAAKNTIPHLKLKDFIGFISGDPSKLYEMTGDLLPFLFPSNGYQWKKENKLLEAELNSYASIRGNEMQLVQSLFYIAHRDRLLIKNLNLHLEWLNSIAAVLEDEEKNHVIPQGSTSNFKSKTLSVEEDLIGLKRLHHNDIGELCFAAGISVPNVIEQFEEIPLEDLSILPPSLNTPEIIKVATERSLELATLQALLKASQYATNVVEYGVFDPSQENNIGFDMANTINISRSNSRKIEAQAVELAESLAKDIKALSILYEENMAQYRLTSEALTKKKAWLTLFIQRHLNGDPHLDHWDFIETLTKLSEEILVEEGKKITSIHAYWIINAKINRLLRQGPYAKLDSAMPVLE